MENSIIKDFKKKEPGVRLYSHYVPLLEKHLLASEFKFILSLLSYITAGDCIIRKTYHHNSKPLTEKEISEICGMTYDYTKKLMSQLIKKGIAAKIDMKIIYPEYSGKYKKVYTVNPFIFSRGGNQLSTILSYYNEIDWEKRLIS